MGWTRGFGLDIRTDKGLLGGVGVKCLISDHSFTPLGQWGHKRWSSCGPTGA